ncbi:MAG: hypothetical protein H7A32_03140 [Deltaproteobacteria bacterium]|nr:hypothetical protein [Deltaproteobacteria bacterium]
MNAKIKNLILTFAFGAITISLTGAPGAQASIIENEEIKMITPDQLPSFHLIEEAAFRYAGLDPKLIQQWDKGAKWAAALPRIQVGWERASLNQNTAIIQDSISVTSSGITIGPESNRIDQDLENNNEFEIKAVWSFNELLFNRDRLDISREARDLVMIRQRVTEELNLSYYTLKSQLIKMQIDPSLWEDPLERLKVEQVIDKLNSLTHGKFSQLLEKNKLSHQPLPYPYGELP